MTGRMKAAAVARRHPQAAGETTLCRGVGARGPSRRQIEPEIAEDEGPEAARMTPRTVQVLASRRTGPQDANRSKRGGQGRSQEESVRE